MWGTSSPDDKLTGDLANAIEAISIDDRESDCLAAGKLAPGNLGLFQQHRSLASEAIGAGGQSMSAVPPIASIGWCLR